MNSKIISLAKNKFKSYLKEKEILDIIIFGSAIKGKALPEDIDIAIISDTDIKVNIYGFHISVIKPKNFFVNPPSITTTILKEGYSLKHNKFLSETYGFSNRVMFIYDLSGLNSSNKVKAVNVLRGKKRELGLVKENKGEWLANRVFIIPVDCEKLFEKFFINFKIKFRKFFILIH